MADIITKFTYLEHGKRAPMHSSFKGIINTASLVGFKKYGERKEAKVLSDQAKEAQGEQNYFNYTNERIGATKTYSSQGWINNAEDNERLKKDIANHFNRDGDFIWVPVISLKDYLTSIDLKLFNEEDYAAVIDKMMPAWFEKAGFDKNNMIWWMDHHVNTDNPHIHLCFLEKKKTRETGKLPMKNINDFKSKFWNEVFSKKRYLEETGRTVEDGFKNKDILKRETLETFKETFSSYDNEEFIKDLRDLYSRLPESGRLQYNSSHMIPYREDLDLLVKKILRVPSVEIKYNDFKEKLQQFDYVRSKSLNTEYNSMLSQEIKKLHVQMANFILNEYKNCENIFFENQASKLDMIENEEDKLYIPVARSLILSIDQKETMLRIPSTGKYLKIENDKKVFLSANERISVFCLNKIEAYDLYNNHGRSLREKMEVEDLHKYFSDGLRYLKDQEAWSDKRKFENFKKNWVGTNSDWNTSAKKIQRASFSWMHKIEQEVSQGQEEFLHGKEFSI